MAIILRSGEVVRSIAPARPELYEVGLDQVYTEPACLRRFILHYVPPPLSISRPVKAGKEG